MDELEQRLQEFLKNGLLTKTDNERDVKFLLLSKF